MSDLRPAGQAGRVPARAPGAPAARAGGAPGPALHSSGPRAPGIAQALWLLGSLAAAVLIALGAVAGWCGCLRAWPAWPPVASASLGRWRLRAALPATALVAAVGWAMPLGWQALHGAPVRATARVVAALAGLPRHAAVAVAASPGGRGPPGAGRPVGQPGP